MDVVVIANEVVDEKRRSGDEGVVFKIDFEKAYDHVDWSFLKHVLERKGFSSKWRSWMKAFPLQVRQFLLIEVPKVRSKRQEV